MPLPAAPSRAELAEMAQTHLFYEVAMLRGARTEEARRRSPDPRPLERDNPKRIACMAFFESALIHARVLNDFLTVPPSHPDDVWAGHYFDNWSAPDPAPLTRSVSVDPALTVKATINKQLAHLSLARLQQTPFYMGQITKAVLDDMRVFAEDEANSCYQELAGVRTLLDRNPWPTEPQGSFRPHV